MLRSVDVAIIGGGVIGCSIAYEISKKGMSCIVFEKNQTSVWGLGCNSWNDRTNLVEELKE